MQCPDGHWFTFPGPCPYGDCGYKPEEPSPPPAPRRENFDRPVSDLVVDERDLLAAMPTERVREVHRPGIAEARRALAEAEHRKSLDAETRERISGGCS